MFCFKASGRDPSYLVDSLVLVNYNLAQVEGEK
jgi:hypothetical protein